MRTPWTSFGSWASLTYVPQPLFSGTRAGQVGTHGVALMATLHIGKTMCAYPETCFLHVLARGWIWELTWRCRESIIWPPVPASRASHAGKNLPPSDGATRDLTSHSLMIKKRFSKQRKTCGPPRVYLGKLVSTPIADIFSGRCGRCRILCRDQGRRHLGTHG